ncbi:MAG: putative Ig domain-containing protein [Chthoniobacterales bacterium]
MLFSKRIPLLVFVLFAVSVSRLDAYVFNGYRWPAGSQIMMHLQLNRPYVPLQDGSTSWDASAADALALWNQYLGTVRFVQAAEGSAGGGDGINSVFFATNIYGQSFGNGVLAVTVNYSAQGSGVFSEADVIFNDARNWNSYRGDQQGSGTYGVYDFHRIALHEFGHVLGLDHPDEQGESVEAIMNSIISDLDHLADDDIAGARALYGISITSPQNTQYVISGGLFSYQITANNNPSSYNASGLPPGIQINSANGLISGRCPTSGSFTIDIVVPGSTGPATGRFKLVVNALRLTSDFSPTGYVGIPFSYQITAENNPTSFSATGLPAALTLDPNTGMISGTVNPMGASGFGYSVVVTARTATSEAKGTVYINIRAPEITSTSSPPVDLGDSYSFQITVSHPVTSFQATGLPPGFQIDPTTGVITGTASQAGYFNATITAYTAYGPVTRGFSIFVNAAHLTSSSYAPAVQIGQPFSYLITASNHPISFSTDALPAGLSLDSATGVIGGIPTLSGFYTFHLTAHSTYGDAVGPLSVSVIAASNYNPPAHEVSLPTPNSVLPDPTRPRIYVSSNAGVYVLDANTLTVVKSFPTSQTARSLELSADGNKLFWVEFQVIKSLDLESLQLLPDIATQSLNPTSVRQGNDGRLYVTAYNKPNAVLQIDPESGALLNEIRLRENYVDESLAVRLSPDRTTLFVAELRHDAWIMARIALHDGQPPTLLQQVMVNDGTMVRNLAVSPDGQTLAISLAKLDSSAVPSLLRSTSNLEIAAGTLPASVGTAENALTASGLVIQSYATTSRVDLIDLATQRIVRSITPPTNTTPASQGSYDLAIDATNSHLYFVGPGKDYNAGELYSYSLVATPTLPHRLVNVATRLQSQTGDNVLIGGFIVTGSEPKNIILRATGSSLPIAGNLADPVLELHGPEGSLLATNDNWNEHRLEVLETGVPPADEHESAIVTTLQPGTYTAIVRGLGDTTGAALVELFDLNPGSASRIGNISTRGKVETGDNVMIGGFILGGDQPTKVIVRAIGPSLATRGVSGALADTTLELHDGNGNLFASNDDWQSDQAQEIIDSTVPPSDPRESAIVRILQPGNYTAIVRGKDNSTGVALVEVFNLETN